MLTTTRSHDHRSRRSHRDERGLALPLLALVLVGLLGVASLVVDLGNWQVEASKVQQAADAAALAGVVALPEGPQAAIDRAREVAAAKFTRAALDRHFAWSRDNGNEDPREVPMCGDCVVDCVRCGDKYHRENALAYGICLDCHRLVC